MLRTIAGASLPAPHPRAESEQPDDRRKQPGHPHELVIFRDLVRPRDQSPYQLVAAGHVEVDGVEEREVLDRRDQHGTPIVGEQPTKAVVADAFVEDRTSGRSPFFARARL